MTKLADNLDRAILRLLEDDGRLPSLEIARRLGVSEKTVRTRIGRLRQQHGMRIVASIDGAVRRTGMLFFVHTEAGRRFEVAERLAALPNIDHVYLTTGAFDMVLQASFASDADALEFLVREVEGAEGVRAVQSSHLIKEVIAVDDGQAAGPGAPEQQSAAGEAIRKFVVEAARAKDVHAVLDLACDSALAAFRADRVLASFFATGGIAGSDIRGAETHRPLLTGGQMSFRNLSEPYIAEVIERVDHQGATGVSLRVVETGLHVFVEDALTDSLFGELRDLVRTEGYRSLLALPFFRGSEVVGTLNLYWDSVRRPSDDDIALAQAFADQVALAATRVPGGAARLSGSK